MEKDDVARAVVNVLDRFSCPEIETAVHIGEGLLAVETTDGDRYFLEVQDV